MNTLPVTQPVIEITYLVASILFILSLKWMSSPSTARRGIWAGEIGMLLAIGGTLLQHGIVDYLGIAIALVIGTCIGVPSATLSARSALRWWAPPSSIFEVQASPALPWQSSPPRSFSVR